MEISQIEININLIKIELDEQKYLSGYKKIEDLIKLINEKKLRKILILNGLMNLLVKK